MVRDIVSERRRQITFYPYISLMFSNNSGISCQIVFRPLARRVDAISKIRGTPVALYTEQLAAVVHGGDIACRAAQDRDRDYPPALAVDTVGIAARLEVYRPCTRIRRSRLSGQQHKNGQREHRHESLQHI